MNILDENYPDDQHSLLRTWKIPHRQIGRDLSHNGIADSDIVPLLHRMRRATFFTQDKDFHAPDFCHSAYCIVWLDVRADDVAYFTRCFLKHPHFCTISKRLGIVARVHSSGVHYWRMNNIRLLYQAWT